MGTRIYSPSAMTALIEAQNIASKYHHEMIRPVHVLYALLNSESGMLRGVLTTMRKDPDAILRETKRVMEQLPTAKTAGGRHITVDLKLFMNTAEQIATDLGDDEVAEEHLMLALIDTAEGPLAAELKKQSITHGRFVRALALSGVGTTSISQRGKKLHRSAKTMMRLWN
ncbi:MAG: Clp protease N-terminal domain-containing protein [Butyricicoccaceae bacterium]